MPKGSLPAVYSNSPFPFTSFKREKDRRGWRLRPRGSTLRDITRPCGAPAHPPVCYRTFSPVGLAVVESSGRSCRELASSRGYSWYVFFTRSMLQTQTQGTKPASAFMLTSGEPPCPAHSQGAISASGVADAAARGPQKAVSPSRTAHTA